MEGRVDRLLPWDATVRPSLLSRSGMGDAVTNLGRAWARLSPGTKTLVGALVLGIAGGIGSWVWSLAQHEIESRNPVAYVVRVDNARYGDDDAAATVTTGAIQAGTIPATEGTCQAVHSWAVEQGAVDTISYLKLTLQGQADAAVSIDDIRIRVLTRDPPIQGGTLVECFAGGANPVITLSYDLDDGETPVAYGTDKDGNHSSSPYFEGHTVTLAKNESVSFQIDVSGCSCHCKWELVLDATVDGEATEIAVRQPNGEPFETTGTVEPAQWLFWMGSDPPVLEQESLKHFSGPCE